MGRFHAELLGDADDADLQAAIGRSPDVALTGIRGASGSVGPEAALPDDLPHKTFSVYVENVDSEEKAQATVEALIEAAGSPHSVLRVNPVVE